MIFGLSREHGKESQVRMEKIGHGCQENDNIILMFSKNIEKHKTSYMQFIILQMNNTEFL